jgi:thioredoxin 1
VINLDKDTFQHEVLESPGFVLVDYWSEGCQPCKALLPDIEALAEKYQDRVKFAKLNVSLARRLAISQQVLGLPTIYLYKDGKKIAELIKDDVTRASIEEIIVSHIK